MVVDDFGVKYHGKDGAEHLIAHLRKLYELKVSWTGSKYLGLDIAFDCVARTCTLSMPGYISQRFAHRGPFAQTKSPMAYVAHVRVLR